jgi:putative ABC transport system permease protein
MLQKLDRLLLRFLDKPANAVGAAVLLLVLFVAWLYWEQTRFMLKSLRRNLLRSTLTALATVVLVLVVTLVWSVLAFLDKQTEEKAANIKLFVSERYGLPSKMPFAYESAIIDEVSDLVDASRDEMTWQFFLGSTDPDKLSPESFAFFFAMDPLKLANYDKQGRFMTMMEDVDQLSEEDQQKLAAACKAMAADPSKVVIGCERLKMLNKRVGERIKVYGFLTYKDINLELEIIGELPPGRYEQNSVLNRAALNNAIDVYDKDHPGAKHPMSEGRLALVVLRVPDMATFEKVAQKLQTSPRFTSPQIKVETMSSGISTFLEGYRDILWGVRWLLVPAILITMALIIANAISISVRERRVEMAVLKVLGFSPNQILVLVLGEALFLGAASGFLSALAAQWTVNSFMGGIALPIGFFNKFYIAAAAPWWGLSIGAGTALAGSTLPAWSARSVKVSEVFSKIS